MRAPLPPPFWPTRSSTGYRLYRVEGPSSSSPKLSVKKKKKMRKGVQAIILPAYDVLSIVCTALVTYGDMRTPFLRFMPCSTCLVCPGEMPSLKYSLQHSMYISLASSRYGSACTSPRTYTSCMLAHCCCCWALLGIALVKPLSYVTLY